MSLEIASHGTRIIDVSSWSTINNNMMLVIGEILMTAIEALHTAFANDKYFIEDWIKHYHNTGFMNHHSLRTTDGLYIRFNKTPNNRNVVRDLCTPMGKILLMPYYKPQCIEATKIFLSRLKKRCGLTDVSFVSDIYLNNTFYQYGHDSNYLYIKPHDTLNICSNNTNVFSVDTFDDFEIKMGYICNEIFAIKSNDKLLYDRFIKMFIDIHQSRLNATFNFLNISVGNPNIKKSNAHGATNIEHYQSRQRMVHFDDEFDDQTRHKIKKSKAYQSIKHQTPYMDNYKQQLHQIHPTHLDDQTPYMDNYKQQLHQTRRRVEESKEHRYIKHHTSYMDNYKQQLYDQFDHSTSPIRFTDDFEDQFQCEQISSKYIDLQDQYAHGMTCYNNIENEYDVYDSDIEDITFDRNSQYSYQNDDEDMNIVGDFCREDLINVPLNNDH